MKIISIKFQKNVVNISLDIYGRTILNKCVKTRFDEQLQPKDKDIFHNDLESILGVAKQKNFKIKVRNSSLYSICLKKICKYFGNFFDPKYIQLTKANEQTLLLDQDIVTLYGKMQQLKNHLTLM